MAQRAAARPAELPTAARRRRAARAAQAPRAAARRSARSAALAALLLLVSGLPAADAAPADGRFTGYVADALRTPTHRLLASAGSRRAVAELVFVDREQAGTAYRTCVRRKGKRPLRVCFRATTGAAGAAAVTPLRFRRGRYAVAWSVSGTVVARWRFDVV